MKKYGKGTSASHRSLTVLTTSDGFGTQHIEIDEYEYNYVISERGTEFERRKTNHIDLLLYWILTDIVSDLAGEWELEYRKPNEDRRRQRFTKEIELVEQLDSKLAKWKEEKIQEFLKKHSSKDSLHLGHPFQFLSRICFLVEIHSSFFPCSHVRHSNSSLNRSPL